MKKILTVAAIGTFIMMGVAQSNAQDTNTNVVVVTGIEQNLLISLQGFSGTTNGGASTVKILNKDVINSLADALQTTFSTKAKLVAITDTNGGFFIVVREMQGKTSTDTDVSPFFSIFTVSGPVTKSSGKGGTAYSIDSFGFGTLADVTNAVPGTTLFFNVQGFTTTSVANGGFNSIVNGPGIVNGSDAVLKGTIKASGGKTKK